MHFCCLPGADGRLCCRSRDWDSRIRPHAPGAMAADGGNSGDALKPQLAAPSPTSGEYVGHAQYKRSRFGP